MAEELKPSPSTVRMDQTPPKAEVMSDTEIERILEESLAQLNNVEEEKEQAAIVTSSIPIPESNSVSEKHMMKQQLMMMLSMMIQMVSQEPDVVRQMIKMSMMMAMKSEKEEAMLDIPIPVGELTGNASDDRVVILTPGKVAQHPDIQSGEMSPSRFEELLSNGTFTLVSKSVAESKAQALQEKLSAPAEIPFNREIQEQAGKMLRIYGVQEKYHEALLTKNDLMIEIQFAQLYILSCHQDLMEIFIDFQVQGLEMGDSELGQPMNPDLPLDSLRKLCKGFQFAKIGHEMTQYLVAYYKLGKV